MKRFIPPFFLILIYLAVLFIFKPGVFSYRFDPALIDRYLCSQDIPYEPPCKRLFLSDGELYISTGYLYAKGTNPTQFSFEHPPVVKYLFGFAILAFSNPFIVQVAFGISILIIFYFAALRMSKNPKLAFASCLLLIVDPLFTDLSSQALLDLGQTFFMLLYFLSVFVWEENFILQGLFLALFAGTKFWVTPMFFVAVFEIYKIYKKKFNFKQLVLQLLTAFIFYSLLYTQSFILTHGRFNIVWHILKTFKYRLVHNTSSYFSASIVLFLTGFLKSWWGNKEIIRSFPWNPIWIAAFIVSIKASYEKLIKKKIDLKFLVAALPIAYLFYLGVQAPFPRYFFITLPFFYFTLADFFFKKFNLTKKR